MESYSPFSFEELAGYIHPMVVDIFNISGDGFTKKAEEAGLTREQLAAIFFGDAMRMYTQARSATSGASANFILEPDWRYVRLRVCDLLTEMFVEDTAGAQGRANQEGMTIHSFAASILVTDLKSYLEGGEAYEIRIGIPEQHLNDDSGLGEGWL